VTWVDGAPSTDPRILENVDSSSYPRSIARLAAGCAVTGTVYCVVLLRLGLEADDRHLLARAPLPLVRRLIERLAR